MLTPKEKAEELYEKFIGIHCAHDESCESYICPNVAYNCAKIAVEECLQTCVESSIYYWKEVLTEIESL